MNITVSDAKMDFFKYTLVNFQLHYNGHLDAVAMELGASKY
jgi:hypothetical protein